MLSVAVPPGLSTFVAVPMQVFATVEYVVAVQTLKLWVFLPLFETLNVTFPDRNRPLRELDPELARLAERDGDDCGGRRLRPALL